MKFQKVVLIMFILSIFVFSSCATKIVCPDGSVVKDAKDCNLVEDNSDDSDVGGELIGEIKPLMESEILNYFTSTNFKYVSRETEPKDSIIKNEFTNMYDMNVQLDYNFKNTILNEKIVYLKIVNLQAKEKLSNIGYYDKLKAGVNTIKFKIATEHLQQNPRLSFCFDTNPNFDPLKGEGICITKAYYMDEVSSSFSLNSLAFDFDTTKSGNTLELSKSTTLKNTGKVPQTFYVFAEDYKQVSFIPAVEEIFLEPGEERELSILAKCVDDGTFSEGVSKVYVYAIPNGCEPSSSCAEAAYYYDELALIIKHH